MVTQADLMRAADHLPGRGRDVALEEYAREMIRGEHLHLAEIEKMARKRGDA